MRRRLLLFILLGEVALAINVAILLSVSLDLDWVRTRAAGGQFDEFPVAIRVLYLAMAVGTLLLMRFLVPLYGAATVRQRKVAKWFGVLFLLSTFTQLISRSSDERWNAIPAVIIAITFFLASSNR